MLTQGNIEEEIIRLSDDESYYADNEYITNSMLSKLNKSPLELYAYMNGDLDTNTQALNFGKAFHTAILEPEKMENVAVFDGKRKVGKAWDVFHAENHDKIILTQDEMTTLESMFARLSSNPMACEHMMLDDKSTQTEIVNIWENNGLYCKGKADIVNYDKGVMVDLKTTSNASPREFERSVYKYGYHRLAAYYLDGFGLEKFTIVAIEKKFPFNMGVYTLSDETIQKGREEIEDLMKEYHTRFIIEEFNPDEYCYWETI